MSCSVVIVSPVQWRAILATNVEAEKPLHRQRCAGCGGLTGCDTVALYFAIGKTAALIVLRSGEKPKVGKSKASAPKLCSLIINNNNIFYLVQRQIKKISWRFTTY